MRVTGSTTALSFSVGLAALPLLLPPGFAAGQQPGRDRVMPEVTIIDAGGAGPDFDTRTVRRGFNLFAGSDAAFSGMRATGNFGTAITNYGDCTTVLRNCQGNAVYVPAQGGWYSPFFEVEWVVAAPPHEYAKILRVTPSIANATGGGWTGGYNEVVLGRPRRFGPADGTLGRMFSGVTSTTDGTCRDHTGRPNGFYPAGVQLLPTSDCPETWGSEGWRGAHRIDQAGWKRVFDRDGNAFQWDFWRVPAEDLGLNLPFLGTHHQTYGETSDYSADVLPNWGAVVPGGVGQPVFQGYPLGLLLHFDAFSFADPRVNDAYFVQVTIVNRSQDVWGTGIDYDSLYFGFSDGALFGNDNASRYALPARGLVAHHNSNVQGPGGPCDQSYRRPDGNGCTGNSTTMRGYGSGAVADIFLKSPLGDLRNKLFTRTPAGTPCTVGQDPFCHPGHPLAGDTLTFNRQAFGDYPSVPNYTFFTGAKATFGYLAANENLTNDGRDPQAQTDRTLWSVFRSEDWTTNKVHYNKYVPPGNWDYNHDGVRDTLALATCGRLGCAVLDSDTMPGGWVNRRGNIGGLQSFGPFALAAGDTTSLIYAMVGDGDSTALWAQVDAVTDLYLTFFAGPEPPPPARVVSTQVTPGTDAHGTTLPEVQFAFSDDPVRWVDPYLMKTADDVAAAAPGTTLGTLRTLNDGTTITIITVDTLPGPVYDTTRIVLTSTNLVAALRVRAAANLERLEIYKSCDGGRSYTDDADCLGDPTTDESGHPTGLGWKPYAVFSVGTTPLPSVFADRNIEAGRTYRYAIVTKSRGATFVLNTPTGQGSVTFAPSLRNSMPQSATDPNLVSVYVPVSRPAGYRAAQVAFTAKPEGSTVPFAANLTDAAVGGSYQAIFGNQILVERDSLVSLGSAVRSTVTIRRRRRVWTGSGGVDSTIEARVFEYPFPGVFPVAGAPTGTSTATLGDTVRTSAWYYALGFVVVGPTGPIFASRTLLGSEATPSAAYTAPTFAGFSIDADNTLATEFNAEGERQVLGPQSLAALQLDPSDSVAPRPLVNQSMVQWREIVARRPRPADGTGRYEVRWQDDAFGLAQGLTMDVANPANTQAELLAALDARATAAVGSTDAETAALLGVAQTLLVPARLPFTVHNRTFDRPVNVAVFRRLVDRIVLGSGSDTVSVAIPDDAWVPGDGLALIEDVEEDSTVGGGLILDSLGTPLRRIRRTATFDAAMLGCETVRPSCNPLRDGEPGATGYTPMHDGDRTAFEYYAGFPETGAFTFDVTPAVVGSAITAVTDSALAQIRVVPNPFVVYSTYQTSLAQGRLVFTHMPPTGTLRIYTVAGQLVQQITWEPADLEGDGDLYWNLATRGGLDAASGLYLWVLTAPSDPTNPASRPLHARGKFVIIR